MVGISSLLPDVVLTGLGNFILKSIWEAWGLCGPPVLTCAVMHVPLPHAVLCGWVSHGGAHGVGFHHMKRGVACQLQACSPKVA